MATSARKALVEYKKCIDFIAHAVGKKGVLELERAATVLFIFQTLSADSPADHAAQRLCELKPHVPYADAAVAVMEARNLMKSTTDMLKTPL